jgi:phosphate-selective porin OprO/OprP
MVALKMKSTPWLLTLALLVPGGGSPGPAFWVRAEDQDAPPGEADEGDVEKRLEELERKLRILERQKEVEQEVSAGKAKDAATVSAGRDGFVIKSADGAYQLKIRALVQADGRFWSEDQARPSTDTFELRRARPIIEGTAGKFFDFRLQPDFGEGKTVLFDAYADWRFASWIRLRAGKFKPPIGLERLQSAGDTTFVERSLPSNLVPLRDVGLQVYGDAHEGILSYAVGLFNGVPDGTNADLDTNDSKETAARVFLQPFKTSSVLSLQNLGFGVAASQGHSVGTAAATSLPSYKTPGQQTFFSYRITTVADGRRGRLSPQAYWYVGRFGLLAEQVRSSQDVKSGTSREEMKNTAWQVTGAFALTDDRPSYRAIAPKRPFDPASHAWGAFEIVARAGALRVDEAAFPVFADPAAVPGVARERGLGANWYLNRNVKLMLDYIQTRFKGGDVAGDREDEKVLLNRFQIAF